MIYRKLHRVGNSWMVTIPRAMCNELGLYPGDYLRIYQINQGIQITIDPALKAMDKLMPEHITV